MNRIASITAGVAIAALAGLAHAEPYKDWTAQKGAWELITKHVDSNHIDDYLTGLKSTWVVGEEIAKKHGVIDFYSVNVRLESDGKMANVMFVQHYTSLGMIEPDKARDQAIEAEVRAVLPKDKDVAAVAGYDKFRTHEDDSLWQQIEFSK